MIPLYVTYGSSATDPADLPELGLDPAVVPVTTFVARVFVTAEDDVLLTVLDDATVLELDASIPGVAGESEEFVAEEEPAPDEVELVPDKVEPFPAWVVLLASPALPVEELAAALPPTALVDAVDEEEIEDALADVPESPVEPLDPEFADASLVALVLAELPVEDDAAVEDAPLLAELPVESDAPVEDAPLDPEFADALFDAPLLAELPAVEDAPAEFALPEPEFVDAVFDAVVLAELPVEDVLLEPVFADELFDALPVEEDEEPLD